MAGGGYASRQVGELIQNAADAVFEARVGLEAQGGCGKVEVRLTPDSLYCADAGKPIDEGGVKPLMFARLSPKRNTAAIGQFGLGFKSVLGVSDAPEFYSRSVSFGFDRDGAKARIIKDGAEAPDGRYPVLRLPEAIDPRDARAEDETLKELMRWASNIVRLLLLDGKETGLARQIGTARPSFCSSPSV